MLRASAWLVLAAGCEANAPVDRLPDDVHWQSEHFDYFARSGDTSVCEAITTTAERHFTALQTYLGFGWDGSRIDYRKFLDGADFAAHDGCRDGGACTVDGQVRSSEQLDLHELVHAYLHGVGTPPELFREGAAGALSCGQGGFGPLRPDPLPWREALKFSEPRAKYYALGRWFVGFLLNKHGPKPFLQLYSGDWADASPDTVEARFMQAYGISLDDEWDRALAETDAATACVYAWECAGESQPLHGARLVLRQDCDAAGSQAVVDVTEPSLFELTASQSETVLRSCDLAVFAPRTTLGGTGYSFGFEGGQDFVELVAGRYFLSQRYGRLSNVAARVLARPDDACAPLPVPPALPWQWSFALLSRPNPWRFAVEASEPLELVSTTSDNVALGRCADCTAAPCDTLASDQPVAQPESLEFTRSDLGGSEYAFAQIWAVAPGGSL